MRLKDHHGSKYLLTQKMDKKIFVTGGTGFVGSHLLYRLASEKRDVLALKRATSDTGYTREVFQTYGANSQELFDRIEWVEGDILDRALLLEVTPNVDKIYHSAAMVSFDPAYKRKMLETNVQGTANVVDAALENAVKEMIHVSSVAALDPPKGYRLIDEQQLGNFPVRYSAYAESKFKSELEVWRGVEEGLKAMVVNPSIIIGPAAPLDGPGGIFKAVRKGMRYYPRGVTGFVDVRDVCRAIMALEDQDLFNERYIVSEGNHSYRYIFQTIARAFNSRMPDRRLTPAATAAAWRLEWLRSGIMRSRPRITRELHESAHRKVYYSNKKIANALDFHFIPVEDSICDTVSHFDEQ